jgi:hypothetical protein
MRKVRKIFDILEGHQSGKHILVYIEWIINTMIKLKLKEGDSYDSRFIITELLLQC